MACEMTVMNKLVVLRVQLKYYLEGFIKHVTAPLAQYCSTNLITGYIF